MSGEGDWHDPAQPPYDPPPDGTTWVWCNKRATGPKQEPGWRWEVIDDEVADIVQRLQGQEPRTLTSCGGHGSGWPHILLEDDRLLIVATEQDLGHLDQYYRDRNR